MVLLSATESRDSLKTGQHYSEYTQTLIALHSLELGYTLSKILNGRVGTRPCRGLLSLVKPAPKHPLMQGGAINSDYYLDLLNDCCTGVQKRRSAGCSCAAMLMLHSISIESPPASTHWHIDLPLFRHHLAAGRNESLYHFMQLPIEAAYRQLVVE